MPAFNRAHSLSMAIESVLRSDMTDWELIIVDDGSIDNTRAIIESYMAKDCRIRGAFHERNMHVHSAKNTGLDLMQGEWFTILDSDDEMLPSAFTDMLCLLSTVDPSIDAITCNCSDSISGEFTGKGLDHDQWLDFEKLVTKCSGEYWGITKRSLLGNERFNSKMRGGAEQILWWKLSLRARRYYLHKALRIYHTEGVDRISTTTTMNKNNFADRIEFYKEMALETEYLEVMKTLRPIDYAFILRNITLAMTILGRQREAWKVYREAKRYFSFKQRFPLYIVLLGGRTVLQACVNVRLYVDQINRLK